ncbi:hypothetical protein CLV47_11777 [Antricoccus suffuscus]|uniref:DUF8185 domain-containing protein n=1 Tax=Antricoccus suffuscus TaxID=1629062 RepID=A0A2T0ZVR3_9ACTN|nr:hypothetical protein CLV47_11777 [Antricoccus suffuscus]
MRIQTAGERSVIWAIVLGTLVRREFHGRLDGAADIAVSATDLATNLDVSVSTSAYVELPASADTKWRGTIPPAAGWRLIEDIPARALIDAVEAAGASLTDLEDHALNAAADSMLSQPVLTVDAPGETPIELSLRILLCLTRMGFLAGERADPGNVARVAVNGPWVIIATMQGAVYRRTGTIDLLGLS